VADILDWLAGDGFEKLAADLGGNLPVTAVEYRQRFLIKAMQGMIR
jgi:hypothetical protein